MGSIGFLLVGMVIANPILPDITNAHFNFGESPDTTTFQRLPHVIERSAGDRFIASPGAKTSGIMPAKLMAGGDQHTIHRR